MERESIKKIYFSGMMLYLLMLLVATTYIWLDGSKNIFVLSIVWMLLVIPLYFWMKKETSTVLFVLLNGIMCGLTMAVYFIHYEEYVLIHPIIGTGFLGLLIINSQAVDSFKNKRKVCGLFALLGVILFVIGFYMIIGTFNDQGSWILFSSVVIMCINFSMYYWFKPGKKQDLLQIIRHYNMLMFGGIFFIVLAVITEGDSLDFYGGYQGNDGQRKGNS